MKIDLYVHILNLMYNEAQGANCKLLLWQYLLQLLWIFWNLFNSSSRSNWEKDAAKFKLMLLISIIYLSESSPYMLLVGGHRTFKIISFYSLNYFFFFFVPFSAPKFYIWFSPCLVWTKIKLKFEVKVKFNN